MTQSTGSQLRYLTSHKTQGTLLASTATFSAERLTRRCSRLTAQTNNDPLIRGSNLLPLPPPKLSTPAPSPAEARLSAGGFRGASTENNPQHLSPGQRHPAYFGGTG